MDLRRASGTRRFFRSRSGWRSVPHKHAVNLTPERKHGRFTAGSCRAFVPGGKRVTKANTNKQFGTPNTSRHVTRKRVTLLEAPSEAPAICVSLCFYIYIYKYKQSLIFWFCFGYLMPILCRQNCQRQAVKLRFIRHRFHSNSSFTGTRFNGGRRFKKCVIVQTGTFSRTFIRRLVPGVGASQSRHLKIPDTGKSRPASSVTYTPRFWKS